LAADKRRPRTDGFRSVMESAEKVLQTRLRRHTRSVEVDVVDDTGDERSARIAVVQAAGAHPAEVDWDEQQMDPQVVAAHPADHLHETLVLGVEPQDLVGGR
jgi:hypothetical protein